MLIRLSLLLVLTAVISGCSSGPEKFPTAGAPGSTQKMSPNSPPAKLIDAAKQSGHMGVRPGRN
ncbi:MAG TPA: hypothetical protein VG944_03145 [Fimbriimonas sp.]|nr:hypothetical protein [Fimbriimonas sp.]